MMCSPISIPGRSFGYEPVATTMFRASSPARDWSGPWVGMPPQGRHAPPSRSSRSTRATWRPSCAARSAHEYPPVPAPITTTSKESFGMPVLSASETRRWVANVLPARPRVHTTAAGRCRLDDPDLVRTPLEPEHVALGAKMGEFAGWSMPIEYAGTLTEHRAVRGSVGIFDLTHLG